MKIVNKAISLDELKTMSKNMYDDLVKVVVDIDQKIMAIDAAMHADEETLLLENGSKQKYLWGINLYPEEFGTEGWIEFDSMINMRPSDGNRSRGVDNPEIQKAIVEIVNNLVYKD